MSDSDDNAFASADEGEENSSGSKAGAKQDPAQQKKKSDSSAGVSGRGDKESKEAAKSGSSPPQKAEKINKGRGKQQSRNKKGKTSGVSPPQTNVAAGKQEKTKVPEPQKNVGEKGKKKTETERGAKTDGSAEQTKPGSKESGSKPAGNQESIGPGDGDQGITLSKDSTEKPPGQEGVQQRGTRQLSSGRDEPKPSSVSGPEEQSIAASVRDHHTPEQEKVLHRLEESAAAGSGGGGGGWGWSSWGSSLLSAASNSVQTFTHQVGDGFTTIMDTVESSLGVPDPKTLAEGDSVKEIEASEEPKNQTVTHQPEEEVTKTLREEPKSLSEGGNKESSSPETKDTGQEASQGAADAGSNWFASWGVGDLAKKVQDTGKSLAAKGQTLMTEGFDAVENLAAGGIDVLENIGKKTFNTLAEHDPALRRTRQFLSPKANKPNLSSTLREAREQAEQQQKQEEATHEALKAHFGTLFDDYQGLAHLEALEILSNQSEKKVHSLLNSLSSEDLAAVKPQLLQIKSAFELDDSAEEDAAGDQDFPSLVQQHLSELQLGTAPDKLNTVHQMVQAWIQDFDSHDSNHSQGIKETHEKSIQALAELTAKGVEQFHKAGEMVLLDKDKDKDCTERAHSLARLTGVLCHEVGNLSNKFVACLNKLAEEEKDKSEEVTGMVTNIYLEASNSSTYVQDAFLLLLPVLQHAALETAILARTS